MKKFFLSGLAVFMLASCYHGATDEQLNQYVAAIQQYYPYTLNDDFVFVNDNTGEKWEGQPYDYYGKGIYPYPYSSSCKEPGASCFGDWSARVEATLATIGIDPRLAGFGDMTTDISYCGGGPIVLWNVKILLSVDKSLQWHCMYDCSDGDVFRILTDTVYVPYTTTHQLLKEPITQPEGGYAQIVKGKGLTAFSIDGETIWRRVQ